MELFMKKKNLLKACLACATCAGMVVSSGCGVTTNNNNKAEASVLGRLPTRLVADAVMEYMQSPNDLVISQLQAMLGYTRSDRFDMGKAVQFAFTFQTDSSVFIKSSSINISEKADLSDAVSYSISPRLGQIDVYNLKTGTKYYYQVSSRLSDNTWLRSSVYEFTTADGPRFMYVDGASNVRDIGGWNSTLGGKIKQGVLYRGSEIDGKKNKNIEGFCVTAEGIETMLSVMGIQSDFDLRNPYELGIDPNSSGILGNQVQRTFLPSGYYEQILNAPDTLKTVFTAFANPDAYPVYLHCTHGVDRAGTISLILEALLGVDKADLIRDYELSNFFYPEDKVDRNYDKNGGDILTLISKLESDYDGATLADKTADMLQKAGVTQAQIDTIRSIFIAK